MYDLPNFEFCCYSLVTTLPFFYSDMLNVFQQYAGPLFSPSLKSFAIYHPMLHSTLESNYIK